MRMRMIEKVSTFRDDAANSFSTSGIVRGILDPGLISSLLWLTHALNNPAGDCSQKSRLASMWVLIVSGTHVLSHFQTAVEKLRGKVLAMRRFR